jgi:hypothetical protein
MTVHRFETNYSESLDYIRRSDHLAQREKDLMLGQSLQRLLGWPT